MEGTLWGFGERSGVSGPPETHFQPNNAATPDHSASQASRDFPTRGYIIPFYFLRDPFSKISLEVTGLSFGDIVHFLKMLDGWPS